jgi:hypothetical protein
MFEFFHSKVSKNTNQKAPEEKSLLPNLEPSE